AHGPATLEKTVWFQTGRRRFHAGLQDKTLRVEEPPAWLPEQDHHALRGSGQGISYLHSAMRVLFTHSYFYRLDHKQWKNRQPYPPLGTLLAAAVARKQGLDVSFFDSCLADGPDQIKKPLEIQRPDVVVIYDDGFNYLTKMCLV